jgi:hypothetical protein
MRPRCVQVVMMSDYWGEEKKGGEDEGEDEERQGEEPDGERLQTSEDVVV